MYLKNEKLKGKKKAYKQIQFILRKWDMHRRCKLILHIHKNLIFAIYFF